MKYVFGTTIVLATLVLAKLPLTALTGGVKTASDGIHNAVRSATEYVERKDAEARTEVAEAHASATANKLAAALDPAFQRQTLAIDRQSAVIDQQSAAISQQAAVLSQQVAVLSQHSAVLGQQSTAIERQTAAVSRQTAAIARPVDVRLVVEPERRAPASRYSVGRP